MPEETKGQSFLTKSFLKNEAFSNKNESIGALNKIMGTFTTKNIKVLGSLEKQLGNLNENIVKLTKPTQQKKDFIRKEDPTVKLIKEVDDLEELFKENIKLQKDKKTKGKGLLGLLGGLGAAFAGAGLLGYVLTGKKELLFNVVKGLMKFSPVKIFVKGIDLALRKAFGLVGKGVMKIPGVKKLGSKIGGFVVKNIGKFVKPVFGLFKGVGKIFGPLGKIFGKGLGKAAGKAGAKGVGKAFLKKIPVVGGLLGLFFGIQRFKKGDKFGGILEIASGIASVVPGIGTALGVAIDAFLIFRDLKGVNLTDKKKEGGGFVAGAKKMGLKALKAITGFGPIANFIEGTKLWKTDKIGAIKKMATGIISLTPAGLIFNSFLGIVDFFKKNKGEAKEKIEGAVETLKEIAVNPKGAAVKMAGSALKAGAGVFKSGLKKLSSAATGMYSKSEDFLRSTSERDDIKRGVEKVKGEKGYGWYAYKNPNLSKLEPSFWNNFEGMVGEYYDKTGNFVQINSAYRNQGNSVHGAGYAIDINSPEANDMEKMGLMKKWGFHRPLLSWKKKKETWHVEPYPGPEYGARNTNNYPIRKAVAQGKTDFGGGGLNLPQNEIGTVVNNNKTPEIELTDRTIIALANAMGASFKDSMPTQQSNQLSIDVGMRG